MPGTTLSASYGFPHRGSTPAVSVDPMHGDLVALAARLRTLPFVESAIVATGHIGVHLQGDATTSEVVERLRPVPTEVPTTVDRDDESVEVTALQPGAAMLATIDSLRDDPRTSQVYFIAGTTYEQADPARAPSGARVAVVTSDVRGVVERLAGTADEAADAHVVPRASYSVEQPDDLADHTEGPVGLPVGSAQPDDTGNLAPSARPGSTTPPWTPADVDAQAAVLRSFLDRSVTATGVHATVTTGTDPCAPSGATLLTGTRATAQVLVPVFTRYDDAQEPFDAVTDAWTADGLRMTDAAMGLDHWAAPDDAAPLASATIRGSTEGLRLTAESVCVG
ncbi:MAG: hypothetical protein INR72_20585 [Williamsia herbipolensis]|nr:hypothetical protein [Williamsia herbipolensis]